MQHPHAKKYLQYRTLVRTSIFNLALDCQCPMPKYAKPAFQTFSWNKFRYHMSNDINREVSYGRQ